MATVRILNGPNRNQTFVLKGGELVGRDPTNAIQVFAPGVSRKHFKFDHENGRFFVQDLGSSNGTFVNNRKIGKHLLSEADTITVGGINLLYSSEDPDPARNLHFSGDEQGLGFGLSPGPGPAQGELAPSPEFGAVVALDEQSDPNKSVVITEDEEEEDAGEDYSLDASIIFDATSLMAQDKAQGLQKRLSLMFQISQDLGSVSDLKEMLEKIMDKLFGVFPQADRGFILLGPDVESLQPVVVRHRHEDSSEMQISKTICRKVLSDKQAILSQNAMEDDRFSGGMSIVNLRILSMACAPLLFREDVFGLIQLDTQNRAKKFTSDDLSLLAGIAAQAAVFLKNLRLFEQAAKEAEARANMQRYFSPALADKVASGEIDLKLGGDLKEGTVFFSDIIRFTSQSEAMSATEVVDRINRYMKHMVGIVFKYQGSVDKFMGDCIMAVWGAPVAMPDEAVAAVNAAVEMQNALFLLNAELIEEEAPLIHMGIGLNSGRFVAGNMGTERRMEYTVLGDDVNLAQRVESKAGRGMVLITESTYELSKECAVVCKLKPVSLKGKAKSVTTYCVRGIRQASSSGGVYMTSLPCAIDTWSKDCKRALLVKVKANPDGKALGLILFHQRPPPGPLTLESYAPEMPRFQFTFEPQGEVEIQAETGCCLKGVFTYKGTPYEELFSGIYECQVSPDDMPRADTPD